MDHCSRYHIDPELDTKRFILYSVWFDIIWVSAVIGQDNWQWLTWLLVVVSWVVVSWRCRQEPYPVLLFMVSIAAIGITVDWLNSEFGLLSFSSSGIPYWLVALWCGFSWYLLCLTSLGAKWSFTIWVLFGALGGASSYFGGARLGAVILPLGTLESIAILAIEWACLFVGVRLWWYRWSSRYIVASL